MIRLFLAFFKIGLFAFGGGFAVLALIQDTIVCQYAWVSKETFLDIVALSQMTPGPIAVNSATLIGAKIAGVKGALVATLGVISPSIIIVYTLTTIINKFEKSDIIKRILDGIRPAALGLIFSAAFLLGKQVIVNWQSALIAIVVLGFAFFKKTNPIILLLFGSLLGLILY
jgi:chromate transporter